MTPGPATDDDDAPDLPDGMARSLHTGFDRPDPTPRGGPPREGELRNHERMSTEHQRVQHPSATGRPKRKLRPEIAARLSAKAVRSELANLYEKPPEELTPEELRKMKSAFLLGL